MVAATLGNTVQLPSVFPETAFLPFFPSFSSFPFPFFFPSFFLSHFPLLLFFFPPLYLPRFPFLILQKTCCYARGTKMNKDSASQVLIAQYTISSITLNFGILWGTDARLGSNPLAEMFMLILSLFLALSSFVLSCRCPNKIKRTWVSKNLTRETTTPESKTGGSAALFSISTHPCHEVECCEHLPT